MRTGIVGNGQINDLENFKKVLCTHDHLICADGGATHLNNIGVLPDIMIGDFDSIKSEELYFYKENGVEIISHPADKNATDMHLAVSLAIERGFTQIEIFGGTGFRIDHMMANIFLLEYMKKNGADGKIIDENNILMIANHPKTIIKAFKNQIISLVALSDEVTGITLKGLKYPLKNATLTRCDSLGISNIMLHREVEIFKESGELLIILSSE